MQRRKPFSKQESKPVQKLESRFSWLLKDWRLWTLLVLILCVLVFSLMKPDDSTVGVIGKSKPQLVQPVESRLGSGWQWWLMPLMVGATIAAMVMRRYGIAIVVAVMSIVIYGYDVLRRVEITRLSEMNNNATSFQEVVVNVGSSSPIWMPLIVLLMILGFVAGIFRGLRSLR